ncbi:MAG: TolC family protein [Candidatus Rifleibacteriota bacterium]
MIKLSTVVTTISLLLVSSICIAASDSITNTGLEIYASSSSSLDLELNQAIQMAVKNNIALKIEKLTPEISKTYIESEKANFDPSVSARISQGERLAKVIYQQGNFGDNVSNYTEGELSWSRKNKAGTRTSVNLSTRRNRSAREDNLFSTRFGFRVLHPLKRDSGREVNLISLKQSELELRWTRYELQGFVLNLIAEIETRYWDYYLSTRQLEIMQESVELAKQQQNETMRRIEAGSIPESEVAAAEAEVKLREVDLINAKSRSLSNSVALLRLLNPDSRNFYRRLPLIKSRPEILKAPDFDLDRYIELALAERPEIEQADLEIRQGKLEIVSTQNGLLPRLDLFVEMGKTGYARSFAATNPKPGEDGAYDVSAGLIYELNNHRRDERARHSRAKLNLKLQQHSMKNLEQLITQEVINAYIEVQRTRQQIQATAATSEKQQEKLRVEEIKFNLGKTTSFQVAQAQRDLTAARIAQVNAKVEHQQACTELLRASGILLYQRDILLARTN